MKRVLMVFIMVMVFGVGMVNHAISSAVIFDFIAADHGTTYDLPNPLDPTQSGQVVAAADGISDSWGIGQVISVYTTNPYTPIWSPGGSGYQSLEFYMGGLDDHSVTWNGTSFAWEVLSTGISTGAKIYLYGSNPQDIDYSSGPGPSDPGNGAGWNVGPGDTLLLELQFVPGIVPGDDTTVLAASFNALWGHGEGAGYLEVVGGAWSSLYDLNGYLGGDADLYFEYSADTDLGMGFWPYGWTVEVDGTANAVPEPATLLLLGSGLIGLVGVARKRFLK